MDIRFKEITLLDEKQFYENQLDFVKKVDINCAATDFALLLGCLEGNQNNHVCYNNSLKGRSVIYYTKTPHSGGQVSIIKENGRKNIIKADNSCIGIRPVLELTNNINTHRLAALGKKGYRDEIEIQYGEYPQYAVKKEMQKILNRKQLFGELQKTGKVYTTNKPTNFEPIGEFKKREFYEFELHGKKYIKVKYLEDATITLSNKEECKKGNSVWVEVTPIPWYLDEKEGLLISKNCLLSGIRMCEEGDYQGDFKSTEIYQYFNTYFKKESGIYTQEELEFQEAQKTSIHKKNPYGFEINKVSEEDIIKGAIESEVPVFLHGKSSEGKSARVKQIDPTCEIIYLRNTTPEGLNGKCVFNQATGEIIDVKPSWLKKLEEKCMREPDRLHIVFFDELTNALPSIQGMAFNIVLDREVNGIWKLPENTRIVAAGNNMQDSIAANQLAEPLFNRFCHVYIETTTEKWLKWAAENHIHPAIYAYIAYKQEDALRSNFNGETPNADPRKWEMASKMLYTTNNPEMLRGLVGEDITIDFVEFCNKKVISIIDVLNHNYSQSDIDALDTAERYVTISGLSRVEEENLETIRNFITKLGKEYVTVFDVLWAHGDNERIEKIAELRLAEKSNTILMK